MNKLLDQLETLGPLPSTKAIRPPNPSEKSQGVWVFKPKLSPPNAGRGYGGRPTPVYYLKDQHTPELVIQVWCNVNQKNVSKAPERALTQAFNMHGSEFEDAWNEIKTTVIE